MNDEHRTIKHCVRVIFSCLVIQACTAVVSLIIEGVEWNNPCQVKSFKLAAWLFASGIYHWFTPFVFFIKVHAVTASSARGTYPDGLMTQSMVLWLGSFAVQVVGWASLMENDDCITEPTALGIWSVLALAVYTVTAWLVSEVSNSLYFTLKDERNAALQREPPVVVIE